MPPSLSELGCGLLSSKLNSPFLSKWATWHNCEKVWKDAKSICPQLFHFLALPDDHFLLANM